MDFVPFLYYQICGEKGWWRPSAYFPWKLPASKSSSTAALENNSDLLILTPLQNNWTFWAEKTQMKLDCFMMRGRRQWTSEPVEMLTSQPLTLLSFQSLWQKLAIYWACPSHHIPCSSSSSLPVNGTQPH